MSREPQVFNALNGVTEGVWRDGDTIIKSLRHTAPDAPEFWRPSADPRSWHYWRRELDAYESGLPARLGLAAPRLLSSATTKTGAELRLEAVAGRSGADLTIDDLAEAARDLGRSNGGAQPGDAWLSRGFLQQYSTGRIIDFAILDDGERWPQGVDPEPFRRLHARRDALLAIMQALPRAVCHLDVFPNNLIARDDRVVFIDWAFVGDGAIGEDVGNLIPDAVFDGQFAADELDEIEAVVTASYLSGLREAGWSGDDRLVMLGIHASAVKYDWLVPRTLEAPASPYSTGPDPLAARWAGLQLIARWADQAIADARALGRL